MKDWIPLPERFWRSTITTKHDPVVRIVFLAMIQLAKKDGYVDESVANIATYANVKVHDVHAALTELKQPDPDSKSTDFEGARIIDAPEGSDGWIVVNYEKYQRVFSNEGQEKRRAYHRRYMRDYRARKKEERDAHVNLTVNNVNTRKQERKGKERTTTRKGSTASGKSSSSSSIVAPTGTTKGTTRLLNKQIQAVYDIHCAARVRFFERVNGRPPGVLPTLSPKIKKAIREAVKVHGFAKAWQAGVGIFYSDWHTGKDPKTDGKRFLGLPLIWSMNADRDNVFTFAEMYDERGGVTEELQGAIDNILSGVMR